MFCIGHSHVACLAAAAAEQGIALTAINFWFPGARYAKTISGNYRMRPGNASAGMPAPCFR